MGDYRGFYSVGDTRARARGYCIYRHPARGYCQRRKRSTTTVKSRLWSGVFCFTPAVAAAAAAINSGLCMYLGLLFALHSDPLSNLLFSLLYNLLVLYVFCCTTYWYVLCFFFCCTTYCRNSRTNYCCTAKKNCTNCCAKPTAQPTAQPAAV